MKERRTRSKDRRQYKEKSDFPFTDDNGKPVPEQRRKNPDRRLNDIVVEWYEDEDEKD